MISYFIFFTFVQYVIGSAYIKVDYNNKTQVDIFNKYVQAVCRQDLCKNVTVSTLCTVRKNNQTNKMEYKEFNDSCRLFMYNFCHFPGQEYYIVTSGSCKSYLSSRRSEDSPPEDDTAGQESTDTPDPSDSPPDEDTADQGSTDTPDNETLPVVKTTLGSIYIPKTNKLALRQKLTKTTKKRYGINSAEDGHPCPYYCPDTYDPMCMNVNVGAGLYFNYKIFINHCQLDMYNCKYYDNREHETTKKRYGINSAEDGHPCPYYCPDTYDPMCMNVNVGAGLYFNYKIFINHCQLDMYNCKYYDNRELFPMPPDEDDWGVQSSKLSFSACADVRYMQFARFSEAASSLGHYGWLPDHKRYSHIMRPGERRPGYG